MKMMRPRFKNNAVSNNVQSPSLDGRAPLRKHIDLRRSLRVLFLIATPSLLIYIIFFPSSSKVGNMDLTYLKTNPSLASTLLKLQHQSHSNYNSTTTDDFNLALNQSEGFFTDIPSHQWQMLQSKAFSIQPNTRGDPQKSSTRPAIWFQQHYEPEFSCSLERRIGRLGDGGKWICDPHRISAKKSECLVYSIGSNGDASFEAAILQDVSKECEIHVFDFDDYQESVARQTNYSKNVYYHQWGISSVTKGKFKTLEDTAKELNHVGRTIDIFKIDCEGCELDTFPSWLSAPVVLRQIVVEIHPVWKWYGARIKMPETVQLFESLKRAGYVITHKEPNVQFAVFALCVEYNFLKLSADFWNS